MIIFGTRGVTWGKDGGEFACPGCGGARQPYSRKTVRRFFTLYFIPVIPLDKIGEYIECKTCGGTYKEEVLNFDPAADRARARAEFVEHLKRVMVLTAVADGHVEESEREAICDTLGRLTGVTLGRDDLDRELAMAQKASIGPSEYSRRFSGQISEHGKELVIKAVHAVAVADGSLDEAEDELLRDLAAEMDLSPAHLRGILAELEEA